MSFTLVKSEGQWSHSRFSVPPLLSQAGVPEETWLATFDVAMERQNRYSTAMEQLVADRGGGRLGFVFASVISGAFMVTIGTMSGPMLLFVICFLIWSCCWLRSLNSTTEIRKKIQEEKASHRLAWQHEVGLEQAVYRPHGIQVQAAQNQLTQQLIIGGLVFQLVRDTSPPPTETRTLVQELESLHQLHQSGSLSLDEYSRAKTKLFRDNNTPQSSSSSSSTNVAFAEVLSVEEDSMTANGHGVRENPAAKVKPFEIV